MQLFFLFFLAFVDGESPRYRRCRAIATRRDAARRGAARRATRRDGFAATLRGRGRPTGGRTRGSKQREAAVSSAHRARIPRELKCRRCGGAISSRVATLTSTYAALPRLSAPLACLSFFLSLSLPLPPSFSFSRLLFLEACPPSLSLTTRCRRTRDLYSAEPPKTITKCQGCHCAHKYSRIQTFGALLALAART